MDKAYYLEYYEMERRHWWFRVRERILLQTLGRFLNTKPPEILNVGAATGRSTEALSRLGKVSSIEYDADCVAFVREKTGLDVRQGSVLDLGYEAGSFDVVCAFDVIEHVEDDALAVREMIRVCKPGGMVFVSVPMYQMLWSEHDEVNRHHRRYTMRKLKALFVGQGGEVLYSSHFNTLLFPPIALARLIAKRKNQRTSDFAHYSGSSWSERILEAIFGLEVSLLRWMRFPFGVSGMLVFRKAVQD